MHYNTYIVFCVVLCTFAKAYVQTSPDMDCATVLKTVENVIFIFCLTVRVVDHPTGKTDDAKVSEKGRSNGTHSTGVDDTKKPPLNSTARTPTSTFGFKKAPGAMATITASGAVVTSGSATVGRIPKSVGFSGSRIVCRQTALDDGYLPPSARTTLQYRSLPRPSRTGAARCANRTNNSSIDASFCNKGTATLPNPKSRNLVKSPTTNQTDREKGIFSDVDSQVLKTSATTQTGMPTQCQAGRQTGGKYPEMSSPTLRR